jgi:hypothetical protein
MALAWFRTGKGRACVTTEIPWPAKGRWEVRAWLVAQGDVSLTAQVRTTARTVPLDIPAGGVLATWPGRATAGDRSCLPLPVKVVDSGDEPSARLELCTEDAWLALDRVEVRRGDDVDGGARN